VRNVVAGLAALGLAACSGAGDCPLPFAGDPSQPVEADVFAVDTTAGQRFLAVHDGDAIPLLPPPQGGFVLFVGAKLRNVDACQVSQTAELRDPATGAALPGVDHRLGDLELQPDGWYWPTPARVLQVTPNIDACPNFLPRGVASQPALLDLHVVDRGGRSATLTRSVVPTCPDGELKAFCECACGPDYRPGLCPSATDAGAGDAGDAG
jgi:hypothetical protein